MNDPHLRQAAALPDTKFKAGLRAIFNTTKAESDAQIAAFQAENRKKREGKKTK